MEKYPRNHIIARIQMTSNKMFSLTLNPTNKKNTMSFVDKEKDVQLETAFTVESVCSSNEQNSACSIKKGESDTNMQAPFQCEVHDDS
jgi:hypothetical protein